MLLAIIMTVSFSFTSAPGVSVQEVIVPLMGATALKFSSPSVAVPVIVETGISDTQNVEIVSGVELDDMVFVNYVITSSDWLVTKE